MMTKGLYGDQHIRYDGSCLIVPSPSIDFMHSVIDVGGKGLPCIIIESPDSVFCPGFQKGRVPSEKGTFSAVNGPSKGHN